MALTRTVSASYTRSSTTVTVVTTAAHALTTGQTVFMDFTSGGALDGAYAVTVTDPYTFTLTTVASGTITTSTAVVYYAYYSRTTTTVTVTTTQAHGMATGQTVYMDFVAGGALDGSYVITVTSTTSFTLTTVASGSISATTCIVYHAYVISASNTLTFYKSSHGFSAGDHLSVNGITGTFPWASYKSYDWVVVASNLTADTFDVESPILTTASGGVELGRAIRGECQITTNLQASLRPKFLQQVGRCVITSTLSATLEQKRLVQAGTCVITTNVVASGFNEITRIQRGECQIVTNLRATLRVAHPQRGSCAMKFAFVEKPALLPVMPATTLNVVGLLGAFRGQSTFNLVRGAETVQDLLDDMAALWGLPSAQAGNTDQRSRLLNYASAAIQQMFGRAEQLDYFNKVTRSYTIAANARTQVLEDDVQQVVGYVRRSSDNEPLAAVAAQNEIERYADTYLTADDDLTIPHAYFVRRTKSTSAYGLETALLFAPTPTADFTFRCDVIMTAPRWTWEDYVNRTPLHIPHRYSASVFYPLAKMSAASAREAKVSESVMNDVRAAYAQAREQLGYVDSAPAVTKKRRETATA